MLAIASPGETESMFKVGWSPLAGYPVSPSEYDQRFIVSHPRHFQHEHTYSALLLSREYDTHEPSEQPARQRPAELKLKAETIRGSISAVAFTRDRDPLRSYISTHAALEGFPAAIRH